MWLVELVKEERSPFGACCNCIFLMNFVAEAKRNVMSERKNLLLNPFEGREF
jgi:hypothetical protein